MSQQFHLDSPHSLTDLLHNALARSPYLGGRRVQVEVLGDSIVISGVVGSYYHKQLAQESLRRYAGETPIHNRLEVTTGSRGF